MDKQSNEVLLFLHVLLLFPSIVFSGGTGMDKLVLAILVSHLI